MPIVGHLKRSGVPTGEFELRLGDRLLPPPFLPVHLHEYHPNFSVPRFEDALLEGIRQHVRPGDRVVVVGGGLGVTSTVAAKQAGSEGQVIVYEGSEEMCSITRRTLAINGVEKNTEVRHAVVGEAISLRGDDTEGSPSRVDPGDLPKCEVMELDCEGAEITILENMQVRPGSILVESHGIHGAPTDEVRRILRDKGYAVRHTQVADSRLEKTCIENDIKVLFATR